MAWPTRYTLRRKTASIIKGLVLEKQGGNLRENRLRKFKLFIRQIVDRTQHNQKLI